MKDNRGFSLVEMVIVVAIIAVLSSATIAGLGYIWGTNVRSCANELKTAIGKTQITTMGKTETTLHIYKDATSGDYYKQEYIVNGLSAAPSSEDPQKIGSGLVDVQFRTFPSGTLISLSGGNSLDIQFDRSSGAQKKMTAGAGAGEYCDQIIVSFGSRKANVVLVPATGKVYID